jgi:hypothetical protein
LADIWRGAILAGAEARCRELDYRSIAPLFPGARQLGFISVFLVLAGAIGLWPVRSAQSPPAIAAIIADRDEAVPNETHVSGDAVQIRPAGGAAIDEPSDRRGDVSPPPPSKSETGSAAKSGVARAAVAVSTNNPASGAGLAETSAHDAPIAPLPLQSSSAHGDRTGSPAAGAAPSGSNANAQPALAGNTSASSTPVAPAAPWQSPNWPAAQAAALQSVQSARIDPAYQDLVRDYFQRP